MGEPACPVCGGCGAVASRSTFDPMLETMAATRWVRVACPACRGEEIRAARWLSEVRSAMRYAWDDSTR